MAVVLSTAARNAITKALIDMIPGGKIVITSDAGHTTVLATLTLSSPAAPDPTTGVATFSTITADSAADGSGIAAYAKVTTSADVNVITGLTVSDTNGSGHIKFASTTFVKDAAVNLTSFTITAPSA